MIRLFQLLFLGHAHKWKVIEKAPYTNYDRTFSSQPKVTARGTQFTMQCERCGNMKVFKD